AALASDLDLSGKDDLSQFENMLVGTLARAASEGFVSADATSGDSISVDGDPTLDESPGAEGKTAYDIARDAMPAALDPGTCRATDVLAFFEDPGVFEDVAVGDLLRNVYAEDGTMSAADTLDLAEYLLSRGYGAEAAQIIDLGVLDSDEGMILTTAALAMDGRRARRDVDLASFALCDSSGGLWALLAGADEALTTQIDITGAIKLFSSYTPHVRRIIGPLLVTHLLTHKHPDDARLAATFIPGAESEGEAGVAASSEGEALVTEPPRELSLARITLGLETGDSKTTPEDLHDLIRESGPDTHDAVLLQSQTRSADGEAPSATEIETLRTLQVDAEQSEQAGELFLTELRRMLDGSDFIGVLDRIDGPHPTAEPAKLNAISLEAWSGLIALGKDFDVALAVRKWGGPGEDIALAPALRDRLSERLTEIGMDPNAVPKVAVEPVAASTAPIQTIAANPLLEPRPMKAARDVLADLDKERAELEAILKGE
ncbi:MAG: hypothetical protein ABI459_10960, partial [Deltaproteobacteria bacterium]